MSMNDPEVHFGVRKRQCRQLLSISVDSPLMLHTLLGLLHFVQLTITYNLVIDTQNHGIDEYLRGFREEYETRLEKYSVPAIHKKRCFGKMELSNVMLTDVRVKSSFSVINDGQYFLRIEHLHTSLHGSYKHNLLFITNEGEFQQDIQELNATLGPLIPISIGGIPYLEQEIPCNIRHTINKIKLNGGFLRWLAKKRLKDAMRDDLDRILCNSMVEILDEKIRKTLKEFQFLMPINKAISISYLLVKQPLPIRYGTIRTFHAGITSNDHHSTKFIPSLIESQHDVIYHIHEGLLSEVMQSVCNEGYMDANLTTDEEQLHMTCQKAAISVKNLEAMNTANLLLDILLRFQDGDKKMIEKNYTVSILHSNQVKVLFRLKSEIVASDHHHHSFNDQIFSIISEVMRSHVSVPLPVPIGGQTERSMVKIQPDRIIFATDFVFKRR